jgi:hypothetical protein
MAASFCHFFTIYCLVEATNSGDSLCGSGSHCQETACWPLIVVLDQVELGLVNCYGPLPTQSFLVLGRVGTHDYFCSFQALCIFWNGASCLTERRGCTFCDYSEQCGNSVTVKFLLTLSIFNHHIWYRLPTASSISTVIVFIAMGTCLLSCQLEMDIFSGFTLPTLRHHVTLHPL